MRSKGIDGFTPARPGVLDARTSTRTPSGCAPGSTASWRRTRPRRGPAVHLRRHRCRRHPADHAEAGRHHPHRHPRRVHRRQPGRRGRGRGHRAAMRRPARLRSPVAEADYALSPPGALPRADDAQRAPPTGAAARMTGGPRTTPRATCCRHRRGVDRDARVTAEETRLRLGHPRSPPVTRPDAEDGRLRPHRPVRAVPRGPVQGRTAADSTRRSRPSSRSATARSSSSRPAATPRPGPSGTSWRCAPRSAARRASSPTARSATPGAHDLQIPVYYGATHPPSSAGGTSPGRPTRRSRARASPSSPATSSPATPTASSSSRATSRGRSPPMPPSRSGRNSSSPSRWPKASPSTVCTPSARNGGQPTKPG